jgi:hypothetical protein
MAALITSQSGLVVAIMLIGLLVSMAYLFFEFQSRRH